MNYRKFGKAGWMLSEKGFGQAWSEDILITLDQQLMFPGNNTRNKIWTSPDNNCFINKNNSQSGL